MELMWARREARFLLVTPGIAQAWLTRHNLHNRLPRVKVIEGYTQDMLMGHWQTTGETVSFDWDGQLVNGQHRLEAIFASGIGIDLLIVTGLDPGVRQTVDTHAKRTIADSLGLAGKGHLVGWGTVGANTAAAMWGRMMLGIENRKRAVSRSELIAFAETWLSAGLFTMHVFGANKRVRSVTTAPVLAAVARAFAGDAPADDLDHFALVLATGLPSAAPRDRGVIVLREYLLESANKNSNFQAEQYGKAARALRAYLDGEVLGRLYMPSTEPFPLPEVPALSQRAPTLRAAH
jgi:hypothetical protein